jgi:hypothetical protein
MIYAKTAKEVEAKRKVPAQVAPLLQSRRPTAWKKRDRAMLASGQIILQGRWMAEPAPGPCRTGHLSCRLSR